MKVDTRCRTCRHEFPEGELRLSKGKNSWGCPKCHSPLIEKIIKSKPPYKWGEINPTYEEGQHD